MKRALWLTNHLLGEREGAAAYRAVNALPGEAQEEIFAAGDRLAVHSVVLAHQYFRHAPRVWEHLGRNGFQQWLALGESLAAAEPSCRDGATVYFALAPQRLSPQLATETRWCQMGQDIARTSRKLSATFFTTTATVLERADAIERLHTWVEVGLRLYRERGWQGEFLAQAYFSAAPDALLLLDPQTYGLWAGIAAAVHPTVKERDIFAALPRPLKRWSASERELFLRATLAFATESPKHALIFYREIPSSLQGLHGPLRAALLRVLQRAGKRTAVAVAEIASIIGALVQQVPEAQRQEAIAHLGEVAARLPDALATALRVLPRLYEEAKPETVALWFTTGLDLAAENLQAGLAFFALESRTSLKVLHAASTAVSLEEAQGVLRKYIHMLSGEPVSLRGVDMFTLRLPLEEFPGENEVALPLRVDLLGTHEENFRIYRFLAAQMAGRRELGTYAFASEQTAAENLPPGNQLWQHLARSAHPMLLEALFLLAEGVRVHSRLCASYRGLIAEARWVGRRMLERTFASGGNDPDTVCDALFAAVLAGEPDPEWPDWLPAEVTRLMAALVVPLRHPQATVEDSMRAADELAAALSSNRRWRRTEMSDADVLYLERVTGDALIDPYFDEGEESVGTTSRPAAQRAPSESQREPQDLGVELDATRDESPGGAQPISPEELRRLLEMGVKLEIKQATGEDVDGVGLYITDLIGKLPSEQIDALRRVLGDPDAGRPHPNRRWLADTPSGPSFVYDEWDYHIGDYRSRWCHLYEINVDGDSGEFFNETLSEYARLIPEVRRQFQRVRPEMYRTVRRLEDGEDFDLNAAIDARIEARARRPPSSKLYVARKREERDVATLFLLDVSASTDEPLTDDARPPAPGVARRSKARRIIDLTRAALVVMAAALEEIGDAYAIYGFSGHGRNNVEFYRVKSFSESLSSTVKSRIGGIQPKRSTRMGTALRHSIEKMAGVHSRSKHLFLLSDGFPQDHDYGQDRRSNVYGIRDTAVALREVEAQGITPFCITVDRAGHDYLRQMCDASRYMVIDDIAALPRELPKVYQRVVRV